MKKVDLNFKWDFNLSSIVALQFQIDLASFDYDDEMSEFPVVFLDLKSGEILQISDEVASGKAKLYPNAKNWLVEGKGWWIGYNGSDMEYVAQLPNPTLKKELIDLFEKEENFNKIINEVFSLAKGGGLNSLNKALGVYQKHIDNEDAPSLG